MYDALAPKEQESVPMSAIDPAPKEQGTHDLISAVDPAPKVPKTHDGLSVAGPAPKEQETYDGLMNIQHLALLVIELPGFDMYSSTLYSFTLYIVPNSSIPRGPNHSTPKETNMENSKKSFVSVLKHGSQSHVTPEITKPALVLDETCIKEFDFGMSLMGRAKDVSAIPNLPCIISKEEKFLNPSGIGSWFTELIQATSSFKNDERIVWISIEGLPIKAWTPNTFRKIVSLWGERKVIIQGKVYWIRVKELDAWFLNFQEDDQDDLSFDGKSQEGDVANKADNNESDVDRVSESSFMHENDTAHKDVNSCKKGEVASHSEDPFNIYGILDGQKNNVCNSCSDEPKFPHGFTPDHNDQEKNVEENIKDTTQRVQSLSNKLNDRCSNRGFSSQRSMNSHSQKSKVGGSILDLMDELVTVGQAMGYNMAGCEKTFRK
uniref:RNA-directed DNA polymerase, eukaryota, nucleotide-binding alpha-beta plait domain protein n=1 Tax=Tanacetum cinerariifolium TaxID=118510 RepID=A0A6L2MLU0_TANCI|nr:RNA-directed DNA polymerase, eukaryota, nucleotide-binding alpha-beta plait domain protein [Tanacetum cinerariifolium]